jgi:hypothetical protein
MQVSAGRQRVFAVLTGAFFACWPAFLNRYPLLIGDSVTYLGDGRQVAQALFLHRIQGVYTQRSEFYSLGILPWHWNITPWPIVAMNALLTSYIVWLVVRSILPHRTLTCFLILMASLSLLTSMSWFVSFISPDILGALLYLCIYLLIFARETLSRTERRSLAPIVVWCAASHLTHLWLAAGLCALLGLLLLARWQPITYRGRSLAQVAVLVSLAAGGLIALHAYLYGRPSLNGNAAPFLMARITADGPGTWYLQAHCASLDWYICDHIHELPVDSNLFLWDPDGIWINASETNRQRLLAEEMPLVRATLRAYPRVETAISLDNFGRELIHFSRGQGFASDPFVESAIGGVLRGGHSHYLHSLQATNSLPRSVFFSIQLWVVILSGIAIVALLPLVQFRHQSRLLALTIVIVPTLIANAFVTGVFSVPVPRYQARIIWLIPLLAALMALDMFQPSRRTRNPAATDPMAPALD